MSSHQMTLAAHAIQDLLEAVKNWMTAPNFDAQAEADLLYAASKYFADYPLA